MDTFRCPTCIAVIADTSACRCPMCRRRIRLHHLTVLGDDSRIGAQTLLVDDWMLERIESSGTKKYGTDVKPVAWHGRFTTVTAAGAEYLAAGSAVAVVEAPAPAPIVAPAVEPAAAPAPPAPAEKIEATTPVETAVVTSEEALDPEVKSILDELYEKARGDQAGDSVTD